MTTEWRSDGQWEQRRSGRGVGGEIYRQREPNQGSLRRLQGARVLWSHSIAHKELAAEGEADRKRAAPVCLRSAPQTLEHSGESTSPP